MNHAGRARHAALKLIFWTLVALVGILAMGVLATILAHVISTLYLVLIGTWVVFTLFTLYFFRDPEPRVPTQPGLIVSPAHGKVDVIDKTTESVFMDGPCQRISIFLSVIDVHVQNAPVSGKITFYKYTPGKFLNALNSDSAVHNENVLLGIQPTEQAGAKVGVKLIAGLIARRIVPFVSEGTEIIRGERISLIQFGSRTDLYLPLSAKIKTKMGDHVVGGETVLATFE